MTSLVSASPPQPYLLRSSTSNWISIFYCGSSSLALSLPASSRYPKLCVPRSGGKFASQDSFGSDFVLRKPSVMPVVVDDASGVSGYEEEGEGRFGWRDRKCEGESEMMVDWENRILEETAPLVGFVRTVLHSRKYESGSRLSAEHENTIVEKLLRYHPESVKKIGCGIDYITVGYHPEYESSRCLFIVRKDGKLVDFSFWKCIKGLIRENYPLIAETFISRHFRSRRS